jgi:hypothetical protein
VQPYEPHPERSHHVGRSHLPAPWTGPEGSSPASATPIYDALYAEYRRLFRALPGDRSGEEELRFDAYGTVHGTGTWGDAWGEHPLRTGRALPAALPPAQRDGHRYGL